MKKFRNNIRYNAKVTLNITGGLYALLGFIGLFVPLNEILPVEFPIWVKIVISILILMAVLMSCFLLVSFATSRKKFIRVFSVNNGYALYLQYGDIFDADEAIDSTKRRNIVIPVNRCFDVHVDNCLISEQTIHGAAFDRLYRSGKYTEDTLLKKINDALERVEYKNLSKREKPKGNRKRYPVGTVVDLPGCEAEHLFLWALSSFDDNLKARTSMQEYVLAVQKLIESCNTESEGFPIILPLVGSGLSRTNMDQKAILRYLIGAFKLNANIINSDIHIVIRNDMRDEISLAMDIR